MSSTIFPERLDVLSVMMSAKISPEAVQKIETPINPALLKDRPSYQKYGSKQYLPMPNMIRQINDIFGYQWSFEIVSEEYIPFDEERAFVKIKGRLTIPGMGIKEQYGTGDVDLKGGKFKDPGVAFSSYQFAYSKATTYAFKACCELAGLGMAMSDTWDEPLYLEKEEEPITQKSQSNTQNRPTATPSTETKPAYTQEQINRMVAFKQDFNIETNQDLVPILKMWNSKIVTFKDLSPTNIDQFLDWAETNAAKLAEAL